MMLSLAPILLLLQLMCVSMQEVRYVKPLNASSFSCPHQPCLTLDQYARSAHAYFTAGSTFVFLSGNHGLQSIISLSNISNITLRGLRHNSTATIVCTVQYAFLCENVSNLTTQWLTFNLTNSLFPYYVTAMAISNSGDIMIFDCTFKGSSRNVNQVVRALSVTQSNIKITRSLFEGYLENVGGAIYTTFYSSSVISECIFVGNTARTSGGAIAVGYHSTVVLTSHNQFIYNTAGDQGGAIHCHLCTIILTGNNSFVRNLSFKLYFSISMGGAVYISHGKIQMSGTMVFSNNEANYGGAIYLDHSTALFSGKSILFSHNSAEEGGGIFTMTSSMKVNAMFVKFDSNVAKRYGGGLSIGYTGTNMIEISATFSHNQAKCGSAIFVENEKNIIFIKVNITDSHGSGLCLFSSNVTFSGITQISRNAGTTGGGISNKGSFITFTGPTWFDGNTAQTGGAINSIQGEIAFHSTVLFTHNRADSDGGGIYAIGSNIVFGGILAEFDNNSALNGGAIYLSTATLTLTNTTLNTSQNYAAKYGGAIYHEDNPTPVQCSFRATLRSRQFLLLPQCFLQPTQKYAIHSYHDSAGKDGYFLYGGLLDKCKQTESYQAFTLYRTLLYSLTIEEKQHHTTVKNITSEATELYLCQNNQDYQNSISIEVLRGQKFTVALLALAQAETLISTQVIAVTHSSRLRISQTIQRLSEGCSDLTYNLYSDEAYDQLILYPNGPCRDSGMARVVIDVTFLPCPGGFTQSGEVCVCEGRLNLYDVECSIDEGIKIVKSNNSNFWMSAVHTQNGSYGGLILYESCPAEYCKTQAVALTLDNLDAQCDLNHSGVLCGQCASNYSLMLGSSRCEICSNHYLALLLAFAAAGLALVVFLTFLKLTVATGTLNSLIFYANVLQVNRRLFLPLNKVNILTVFIAWLNLDLGIETCFYDGLTAYAQTWLQFVFPVYVWVLISSIILTARHSVLLSRLIGSDPIAVLATLLLMSYTKILRIIIEVYSFVDLDYPEEEKVRVWLKDGNVDYQGSTLLFLTVVTSLVLVLFFLPYTLLLLLGHRLYRFTGWKHFHWFSRIKPLLESYYAPYKPRTRYWTGFLLLVRCALYIVFSFNSLRGTKTSLLAISLTFTALAILGSGRIYKNMVANVVEMFVYFNLVILSTATLAEYKWPALVYLLVGVVFATMVCAIVYQFHLLYIAKTALWLRVKAKLSPYFQHSKSPPQPEALLPNPSHNPHKIVSKTVIELREPLLET